MRNRPLPKPKPDDDGWEQQLQFLRYVADTDPSHGSKPQPAPRQPQQAAPKPAEPDEPLDIHIRRGPAAMREAIDFRMREAINVRVTGAGDQKPGGGAPPPAVPGQPAAPGVPGDPMQPPPPKDVMFTTLDRTLPGRDEKVDWYVDVDFPPIVQKDIQPFLQSLKVLGEMLPGDQPESRRLLVTMALTALGINDLNQVLDQLFPATPPGQKQGPGQPLIPPTASKEGTPNPSPKPGSPMSEAEVLGLVRDRERIALLAELSGG